ncbi:MAG: Rieske 2Fe-2S domain-containing protein [Alphaproteobacteria bacterium]
MSVRGGSQSQGTRYSGYHHTREPAEDAELTHVRPGTPCGEYLRRFWQPILMASELRAEPRLVTILGETLVIFRNGKGEVGLLHKHCVHRRASLEFGRVEESGLRCCYHGWLFAPDGAVLETPGEPPFSRLKERVFQPAYPVREYKGLIFAYFGPPEETPAFPIFDTFELPGAESVTYCVPYDCNWLQIMDNSMDPVHSSFLHTSISGPQFSAIFGALPVVDYHERPLGFFYTNARRVGDHVWIRTHDNVAPNMAQSGAVTSLDGGRERLFGRAGFSRWIVPVDDTHSKVLALRYFGPRSDAPRDADKTPEAFQMLEAGGLRDRPYDERRRQPSDFEALEGQGAIVVHAAEHLGTSDVGVAMRRQRLRAAIRATRAGERPVQPMDLAKGGCVPSHAGDTVLRAPMRAGTDDRAAILDLSRKVAAIYVESEALPDGERQPAVERRLRELSQ